MTDKSIHETLRVLGPWHHRIDLPGGVVTPGTRDPKLVFDLFAARLPDDLDGLSVLDLGANACGLSIEFAMRGANVVAVELGRNYVRQAEFVLAMLGLDDRVEVQQGDVYSALRQNRTFDIVCYLGLGFHLRHPQLALDMLTRLCDAHFLTSSQTIEGDELIMSNRAHRHAEREMGALHGWEPTEALLGEMIAHSGFRNVEIVSTSPHSGETFDRVCGNRSYFHAFAAPRAHPLPFVDDDFVGRSEQTNRATLGASSDQATPALHRIRSIEPAPVATLEPNGGLWRTPGHYYSPIPDSVEIDGDRDRIWSTERRQALPGIDLNIDGQIEMLRRLATFHPAFPEYGPKPLEGHRFVTENRMYGLGDAGLLYSFMRLLEPSRLVEVGSGYSSAVALDTAEHFLNPAPQMTFIEPYPERLERLLTRRDRRTSTLLVQRLQDVESTVFDELESGDILVIDSSHVAKTGSDVVELYTRILPAIRPGVFVHIHDIGFPFEYPMRWVDEGRSWNEAYVLHAFLVHNWAFEICLWNSCLESRAPSHTYDDCPRFRGGSQIWLRRV